ncbi:MAG: mechanosensitive ion channel family protein [Acidobacteriota bacterium]
MEHAKRARTLTSLIHNLTGAFIFASAGLMILDTLGVNITPILTGAGILGLAVSFGAQALVKDIISGFFLIIENQIRVGDSAEINGVSGLVEAIHLRTVILRDVRGAVHIFPCGSITTTTNLTKDHAYAVIDVMVPLERDPDAALALLTEIGTELRADANWSTVVIDAVEVLGIDTIGPSGVTIRARIKTLPQRQWDVARELRRRVTKAFASKGIDLRVVQKMVMERPDGGPGL